MEATPKYIRARLAAIEELIEQNPSDKDNSRAVLRNGVFLNFEKPKPNRVSVNKKAVVGFWLFQVV